MKKTFTLLIASALILLSSCISFKTIDQPSVARPNEIITVAITATTEGGGAAVNFGVCLPIGWTIPGDSLQCYGVYNEVIYYDESLSGGSPAPQGYYWWVGEGAGVPTDSGDVFGDLQIQTDNQTGLFSIDYMLEWGNGRRSGSDRSDNHLIDIVDNEYTPWRLQATIIGGSINLNWKQPFNTNGLLGYNIYRDEQQINTFLVTDTTFIDENPLEGLRYYSISSLYNDGNEYIMSYPVRVMLGNSLCVSPDGSNKNNGTSFEEALLTIDFAIYAITPDSLNHKTIYLSQGIFSPSTTGEVFPLVWKNHTSLEGISEEVTILDGESLSGVIQLNEITDSKIKNIKIRNGYARYGGGISSWAADFELVNVTITDSYADNGGGIFCEGYGFYPDLVNVTIINNSAVGNGGGIYLGSGVPELVNVTITNNSAGNEGGGIFLMSSDGVKLVNVTITNNTAGDDGGGICSKAADSELVNVTVTNNTAGDIGGGIFMSHSSDSYLVNSIFWNNSPQEIDFGRNRYTGGNSISIFYSDIQGGLANINTYNKNTVHWLEGNIDEDPLFIGTGDYPYSLSSGSPCIDVGNPDAIYNDPEDPNNPGYALWPAMGTLHNDMGAYGGPYAASWIIVGIEDDETEDFQTPTEFELSQNYPNPFNPSTTIQYGIKERSSVELVLYDILGSQVVVLVNEEQDAGYYKIDFNAGRLASGIYFYRLQTKDFIKTKKMVLLK